MWEVEKQESVYASPFANVLRKYFRGQTYPYLYIDVADFCNVIPVTAAGEIVMVKQFRVGIEKYTLEIPGGLVDAQDPSPRESALRELREETGYDLVEGGKIWSLGWSHPNPAMAGNRCHFYACGPVEPRGEVQNDPNEHTETVLLPIAELRPRLRNGDINHALILNAFQRLEFHGSETEYRPFEALLEDLRSL